MAFMAFGAAGAAAFFAFVMAFISNRKGDSVEFDDSEVVGPTNANTAEHFYSVNWNGVPY